MASDAVPVAGMPASKRAWLFASVAVATALMSALSLRRVGTKMTVLMVPAPRRELRVRSRSPRRVREAGRDFGVNTLDRGPFAASHFRGGEHADAVALELERASQFADVVRDVVANVVGGNLRVERPAPFAHAAADNGARHAKQRALESIDEDVEDDAIFLSRRELGEHQYSMPFFARMPCW